MLTKPDSCVLLPLCGGRAGLDVGQGATPPPTLIPQHRRAKNSPDRSSEDAGSQTSGVSPFLVGAEILRPRSVSGGRRRRRSREGSDLPSLRIKVTSVGSADDAPRPLRGNPGNQDTAGELWEAGARWREAGLPPAPLGVSPRFCVCAGRGGRGSGGAGGRSRERRGAAGQRAWRSQTPHPFPRDALPREERQGEALRLPTFSIVRNQVDRPSWKGASWGWERGVRRR